MAEVRHQLRIHTRRTEAKSSDLIVTGRLLLMNTEGCGTAVPLGRIVLRVLLLLLGSTTLTSSPASAATLMIPSQAGVPMQNPGHPAGDELGCIGFRSIVGFGVIYGMQAPSETGLCSLYFHLPLEQGQVLQSVTLHYYDPSGDRSLIANVYRLVVNSHDNDLLAHYVDGNAVPPLGQKGVTHVLQINSSVNAQQAYFAEVYVSEGTVLKAITMNYM